MTPGSPPAGDLRARAVAALRDLPLPPGGRRVLAESVGAPPLGPEEDGVEDLIARLERVEGGLTRALALGAELYPERARALLALASEARRRPPLSGGAWAAAEASRALVEAGACLRARGRTQGQARAHLARARALLDGPLAGDPEREALDAGYNKLIILLESPPPPRSARGLWLLTPLLLVGAILLWPPAALEEPAPGALGLSRGLASAESSRSDLLASAPAVRALGMIEAARPLREEPPAPHTLSPPSPRAPKPSTTVLLEVELPEPAPEPAPEPEPEPEEEQARRPRPARVEVEDASGLDAGGGHGGAHGSGTIRHTALAERAPMDFLGVEDLPTLPGEPEAVELWVAKTEVTEAQWLALMRVDLAILTGRPERPAEHMTWCEALTYANLLSKEEGLQPAYEVPRGCHLGARVRWRTGASGYRLPTEEEWERMAGMRPGSGATRRDVVLSGEADGAGLYGVSGNAAELVWSGDGVPVARHRSCEAESVSTELWPESEPLPCRRELPPGQRALGVGLRLVRSPDD